MMRAALFVQTGSFVAVLVFTISLLGQVLKLSAQNQEDALPDVVNVTIRSFMDTSITASWVRPKYDFDYYRLDITENKLDSKGHPYRRIVGSCGIDKYGGNHVLTACAVFEACTNVNLDIWACGQGPSGCTFLVNGVGGIFVPGHDPDSPSNITMVEISPLITRIQWEPPVKVHGRVHGYTVKICEKFTSCERQGRMNGCTESHTSETWLDINNYVNSKLCVLVTAKARCGSNILSSRPVAAELTNISLVFPEVENLTLIDVWHDYFTVSWTKPAVNFDYYWVEVQYISKDVDMLTPHRVGSCANGSVVHRSQTQITCDKFKACANVSVTVHAQVETASHLAFPGATLRGIFLPGRDLPEVTELEVTDMDEDSITVSWLRPGGCFDNYIVEVAEENRGRSGVGGLSSGSCAGGIAVDAKQSSITCGKIEACSVRVTVRTQRRGPVELTSSGVTVHDIVMSKKDLPEVLSTLDQADDSFTLRWNRPIGCFDKYILEVTNKATGLGQKRLGFGSCTGTTILDPDLTNVTCSDIPGCSYGSAILRTQRNGPNGRTSLGGALPIFLGTVHVDYDMYLGSLTKTWALIVLEMRNMKSCQPRSCGAVLCRYNDYGKWTSCSQLRCDKGLSNPEWVLNFTNLSPGTFYRCRVEVWYNFNIRQKELGFRTIQ